MSVARLRASDFNGIARAGGGSCDECHTKRSQASRPLHGSITACLRLSFQRAAAADMRGCGPARPPPKKKSHPKSSCSGEAGADFGRRCARHDSNMRPLPPQGSALSPELRARGGQCSRGAARSIRRRSRHARLRLERLSERQFSEEVVMAAKRPDFFRQRSALSPELRARGGQCSRASAAPTRSTASSGTSRLI